MPLETQAAPAEVKYTHRSFELAFAKFCSRYAENLATFTKNLPKDGSGERFMGLPADASIEQIRARFNEVAFVMGESPGFRQDDEREKVDVREAILLSARHLAWYATMGNITQQYVDKIDEYVDSKRPQGALGGNGQQSMQKLNHYRDRGETLLLAQNHAIRDYFDSPLASTLGNDSPEKMKQLLDAVPYAGENYKNSLVRGVSLEIAAKRHAESRLEPKGIRVAYGSDNQDARGGDLVVIAKDEIVFVDMKSSMPREFSDGSSSDLADEDKGYKWLDTRDRENKAVVWAYEKQPVAPDGFYLADKRLAANLDSVLGSIEV